MGGWGGDASEGGSMGLSREELATNAAVRKTADAVERIAEAVERLGGARPEVPLAQPEVPLDYKLTIEGLTLAQAQHLYRWLTAVPVNEPLLGGHGMSWRGLLRADGQVATDAAVTIDPLREKDREASAGRIPPRPSEMPEPFRGPLAGLEGDLRRHGAYDPGPGDTAVDVRDSGA